MENTTYNVLVTLGLVLCLVGLAVMASSMLQFTRRLSDEAFSLGAKTMTVGLLIFGYIGAVI